MGVDRVPGLPCKHLAGLESFPKLKAMLWKMLKAMLCCITHPCDACATPNPRNQRYGGPLGSLLRETEGSRLCGERVGSGFPTGAVQEQNARGASCFLKHITSSHSKNIRKPSNTKLDKLELDRNKRSQAIASDRKRSQTNPDSLSHA